MYSTKSKRGQRDETGAFSLVILSPIEKDPPPRMWVIARLSAQCGHLAPGLLTLIEWIDGEHVRTRKVAMKINLKARTLARKQSRTDELTTQNQRQKRPKRARATTEFGRTLKDLLGKTFKPRQLNEEELFAATTYQLITNRHGESIAEDFRSAFKLNMVDKPPTERFSSPERAAKESLKFFVRSTLFTREEARDIRQLAFASAQLDDNIDEAWDSLGDTRAVTSFRRGEQLVQGRLEASGNAPVIASRRGRRASTLAENYGENQSPKFRRGRRGIKSSA